MTLVLALLLWTQAAPVAEETQAQDTAAESETPSTTTEAGDSIVVSGEKSPENQIICVYERKLGTSIKKRVCRTAAQIEAEAEVARQSHGEMARRQASQRLESTRSN